MFEGFIRWFVGAPPAEDDEEGRVPDDGDGDPPDAEAAMSESLPDAPESADGGDPDADAGPDPDTDTGADAGLTVDDLEYRVDELGTELERIENATQATQRSQEDVAESVEELEATVRRLVGVYDRLTDDVNPFADDDSFGVVGGRGEPATDGTTGEATAAVASPGPERETAAETAPVDGRTDDGSPASDDGVTSFEDLKRARAAGGADAEPTDAEPTDAEPTDATGGAPAASEPAPGTAPPERTAPAESPDPGAGALLESLGTGYATDVVVFEWLSMLVEDSGPAGALKALDYYETVGWIAPDVHECLRSALGGPTVDVTVDPSQPSDLAAGRHAESYAYATQLRVLDGMDGGPTGGR